MCYNAPVSFGTFLFVAAICGFLWVRNRGLDRPISLILLVVVLMQLVEGFLWLLPPDCGPLRQLLSAAIPVLLYLQPLLINAIVAWFGAGTVGGYGLIALLFLLALPFQIYSVGLAACVTADRQGHLDWSPVVTQERAGILPILLYDAAMVYPLLTLKNPVFGLLYTGAAVVSRLALRSDSVWCHFVNGLAVFALLPLPIS
jgi:hypothetical protein